MKCPVAHLRKARVKILEVFSYVWVISSNPLVHKELQFPKEQFAEVTIVPPCFFTQYSQKTFEKRQRKRCITLFIYL